MPPSSSPVPSTKTLPLQERLALAAAALETYRASCFWSLAPGFAVTEATLPLIVSGLRRHGDRAAFQLADRLCH
jgi:hypothetical protein